MEQTNYEARLGYSAITRFLHAVRYKHLVGVLRRMAERRSGSPIRVLDIGCSAAQCFGIIDAECAIDYVGIETRRKKCAVATERFGERANFTIVHNSIINRLDLIGDADLVIALETLEHIPAPMVAVLIETIGGADIDGFYCTVPNEIGPAIAIKNIGSALIGYGRHREYGWKDSFHAATYQLHKVAPHTTKHKGFDWRQLERKIRRQLDIRAVHTSPWQWVPRALSPSIGFYCTPRADAQRQAQ